MKKIYNQNISWQWAFEKTKSFIEFFRNFTNYLTPEQQNGKISEFKCGFTMWRSIYKCFQTKICSALVESNLTKCSNHKMIHLQNLNNLDYEQFINILGNVVEHCPLIAASVWSERPFSSPDEIMSAINVFVQGLPITG